MGKKTDGIQSPMKIRLFSRDVTFKIDPGVGEYGNALGMWRPSSNEVVLDSDQTPSLMADTLLHELFHATWHHFLRDQEKLTEEQVVSTLATGIVTIFRQNPQLFQLLSALLFVDGEKK